MWTNILSQDGEQAIFHEFNLKRVITVEGALSVPIESLVLKSLRHSAYAHYVEPLSL